MARRLRPAAPGPANPRPGAVIAAAAALAAIVLLAHPARAEIGDLTADRVLGQATFADTVGLAISASTFASPRGVAIDTSVTPNRVYVSDSAYHRVLGWSDANGLASGAPADIVLGQADFASFGCNRSLSFDGVPVGASAASLCEPAGLAVDGAGRLYVADSRNCRVLVFEDPFGSDSVADAVVGQPDFTTSTCTGYANRTAIYDPMGVTVDAAGNLFVADTLHCRVLEYDSPLSTDLVADRVYGQPDFTSDDCNSVANLYFPRSVAVDPAGNLWVGSTSYLYEIDAALGPDRTVDRRLGSQSCNDGGETASSSCSPTGVATDAAGHLYVADAGNNRVLEYDTPLGATPVQAARVFGQSGFGGSSDLFHDACNDGGPGAASLCLRRVVPLFDGAATYDEAAAVAVDGAGRLWVADGLNNRLLRYDAPLASDAVADLVLGHSATTDVRRPTVPIDDPRVAVGRSYELVVADRANNRLLVYGSLGSYPDTPVAVIGQPDLGSTGCNTGGVSASSLCNPSALSIDPRGNLWVADSGNHRVLGFDYPWLQYDYAARRYVVRTTASRVQGQADFASSAPGSGPTGLSDPEGVAADASGALYVSDTGNNRVVENQNALADAIFERAFGQTTLAGTACNAGGRSASSLCAPRGLTVGDDDTLYVTDHGNHRVLAYRDAYSGDTQADRVFGQGGSMTAGAAAGGAGGLNAPSGVGLDPGGNLYVADTENNRVLEIDDPLGSDGLADRVFGQPDMASTACKAGGATASASTLCAPTDVAVGELFGDEVFVADAGNRRVLRYDAPFCRLDFQLTAANRRDRSTRSKPTGATVKVKYKDRSTGGGDLLTFAGGFVLLERDGGISPSDEPLLTLSTAGGVVFQERVPYLHNEAATPNGGIWKTEYLKGTRNSGIDDFVLKEAFVIPPGFTDAPQFDRISYRGRAVGLDLAGFTAGAATFRLQSGSICLTTELACRTGGAGRTCKAAR